MSVCWKYLIWNWQLTMAYFLKVQSGILKTGKKERWLKVMVESSTETGIMKWEKIAERGKARFDVWRFREETNTFCWYGMSNGGKQKLGEKGNKSEEPTFVFWATQEMVWL